ncbi:hypothetical protein L6R49_23280 [Myxococcota bacterium]|nr:hypothetical protein [Myxococcota bacterium]
MAAAVFTLALPPELGGAVFGPFEGVMVAIGTDASRCNITLNPGPGLMPVHAFIAPRAPGQYTVQATEYGAEVYVFQGARATRIDGSATLKVGDSFALGDAGGPRFIVGEPAPGQGVASQSAGRASDLRLGGRRMPTAADLQNEVQRQAMSELMRQKPIADAARGYWRVKSGAIFQPRYIIGAVVGLGSVMVAGCGGLLKMLTD